MYGQQKKRQRIPKACNYCRKRKIKCDGLRPCWNCRQGGIEVCTYAVDSRSSSKYENIERNKLLEERLSRIESSIEKLNNHIRINEPNIEEPFVNNLNSTNTPATEIIGRSETSINSVLSRTEMGISCDNSGQSNISRNDIETNEPANDTNLDLQQLSGSQFNFCRFSNKFIGKFKQKLPKNEHYLLFPFERMQTTFSDLVQNFELKWVETSIISQSQRDLLLHGKFLGDPGFVMTIIEEYYEQNFLASYIYTLGELKELFGVYYKFSEFKPRKLEESELLILNITLTMSIYAKLDEISRSRLKGNLNYTSEDIAITIENLNLMHEEYLSNSIFYYHRLMIFRDGFQTIRALLLLLIYAEYNISNSHVDQVLLCLAIRYAQDIGLQRYENFCHLPKGQIIMRQRVWWLLEYFDVEMAFRKGRPPTINLLDDKDMRGGISLQNSHTFDDIFYTLTKQLTRLRNKSYTQLLNTRFRSFNEFCNSLDKFNEEMLNIGKLLTPDDRPLLLSSRDFDMNKLSMWINNLYLGETQNFKLLACHIGYFSHLLALNTIPSISGIPTVADSKNKWNEYRTISTNCCITILEISFRIERHDIPKTYLNNIIHQITSAFLCLLYKCGNDPTLPDTHENINLLLKVSRKFFGDFHHDMVADQRAGNSTLSKDRKLELLCIVALRVAIRIVEVRTRLRILDGDSIFMKNVYNIMKMFPAIFEKSPNIDVSLNSSKNVNESVSDNTELVINLDSSKLEQPLSRISSFSDIQFNGEDFMKRPSIMTSIDFSNPHSSNEFDFWSQVTNNSVNGEMSNLHNFFFDKNFGI